MSIYTRDDVVYPVLGLSHMTNDISDLIAHQMANKESIRIYHAIQPNSHPHIGSVTTLMTAFALASHFADSFGLPVSLTLDALENSPSYVHKKSLEGVVYEKSLNDTFQEGHSLADLYLESFRALLDTLSKRTGIPSTVRSYEQFQHIPLVRRQLLTILQRYEEFAPIVSPSEKRLHVRFPCPMCHYMDKNACTVRLKEVTSDMVRLTSRCCDHAEHSIDVREANNDFIDMNAALRDLTKGVLLIEESRQERSLCLTVAGGDWGGMWILRVFCEGLAHLGYTYEGIPPRFFAPIITDWSGAKFSKSLYVASRTYDSLPKGLLDFSQFRAIYGEKGLDLLWEEVQTWVNDPKRLFRNYSVEYFKMLLNTL